MALYVSSTPRRTQGVKREHSGSSTMYQPARSRPRRAPTEPMEDTVTDTDEPASEPQQITSSQIYDDIERGDVARIAARIVAEDAPALYHGDADDEDDGEDDVEQVECSRATSEGPLEDNAPYQLRTPDQHEDSDGSDVSEGEGQGDSDGDGDINGSEPGDGDGDTNRSEPSDDDNDTEVSGEGALGPAPPLSRSRRTQSRHCPGWPQLAARVDHFARAEVDMRRRG
jgi:hypothetical protein